MADKPTAGAQQSFDYDDAFCRNLGLVEPREQQRLRDATVAIAGLGGVGGVHALTLARLGIGGFHLADFDRFELHNFNRQAGATMSSLGQRKTQITVEQVRDINPQARIECFFEGVTDANVGAFLEGVDVVVDGLDFFALEARDMLYEAARAKGLPVVSAGPIGCSTTLLVFLPQGMRWRDYFAMDSARSDVDRYLLFALGSAPKATQLPYLDRRYVDLARQRGPSLSLAVQLCAGVTAAEVLKLLLGRGTVLPAPYFQQFDAYSCRHVIGRLRWGNRGLVQRLKFRLFRRWLATAGTMA